MSRTQSPGPFRHALHSDGASFLPPYALRRALSPEQFLYYQTDLEHIRHTARTDLLSLLHSRGWQAHGASHGPQAVFIKIFPDARRFQLSEAQALRLEISFCAAVARFDT